MGWDCCPIIPPPLDRLLFLRLLRFGRFCVALRAEAEEAKTREFSAPTLLSGAGTKVWVWVYVGFCTLSQYRASDPTLFIQLFFIRS